MCPAINEGLNLYPSQHTAKHSRMNIQREGHREVLDKDLETIICTLFPTISEKHHSTVFFQRLCVRAAQYPSDHRTLQWRTLWEIASVSDIWNQKHYFLTFKFLPPEVTYTHTHTIYIYICMYILYIYIYVKEINAGGSVSFWVSGSFLPNYNVPHPGVFIWLTFCYKLNRHTGGVRLEEGPCQVNFEFLANGSLYISFQRPNYVCINKLCYAAWCMAICHIKTIASKVNPH